MGIINTDSTREIPRNSRTAEPRANILTVRLVVLGLVLNVIVALTVLTPFSLRGVWSDIIVTLAALVSTAVSLFYVILMRRKFSYKWLLPLVHFPMYVFLIVGILSIAIPGMILGLMFGIGEIMGTDDIQKLNSPDNSYQLIVRYTPVGAYTGGMGRYAIVKTSPWLPFLERQLYYEQRTYMYETDTTFFHWVTNDSILITETNERIKGD